MNHSFINESYLLMNHLDSVDTENIIVTFAIIFIKLFYLIEF